MAFQPALYSAGKRIVTRRKAKALPIRLPGDSERMSAALDWCLNEGLAVRRCTPYQLRVGPLNFWPDRGTITWENCRGSPSKGLAAFKQAIALWQAQEQEKFGVRDAGRVNHIVGFLKMNPLQNCP